MRRFLLVAALVSLASPASADVGLFTRVGAIWVTDPAFDLVSETDGIPNIQLGAEFEAGGPLALEVAWGFSSAAATTFDTIDSSFFLHQFQGAALYRVPITEHLRTFARGAAGLELGLLRLEEVSTLEAEALGLGLEGTLGTELRIPLSSGGDRWSSSFAFSVEAGYGFRPFAMTFDDATVDGGGVEAGPIDVGDLSLSGPILRFGAALRF